MALTVYEKPACSTCRNLRELLDERGVEYTTVDYISRGLPAAKIRELLEKAGLAAREAVRAREAESQEIAPDEDDAAIVARMAANPALLQRPFVEAGDRAVLARPVELALELL